MEGGACLRVCSGGDGVVLGLQLEHTWDQGPLPPDLSPAKHWLPMPAAAAAAVCCCQPDAASELSA